MSAARATLLLLLGLQSCGPAAPARVRAVNASTRKAPVDVTLGGGALVHGLRHSEASLFQLAEAGQWSAEVLEAGSGAPLGQGQLELQAAFDTTVVLAPSVDAADYELRPVLHAFAAPEPGLIRARLVHAAALPELAVLIATGGATEASRLPPGRDSGPSGFPLLADHPATLTLSAGQQTWRFEVPALPSLSEVFLVLVNAPADAGTRVTMLGVAPSAALGFMWPDAVQP